MFKPLSINIGLRYTRAKKRNHFISFISLTSMIGIALGVLVLITVLSVMNGFDRQIQDKVFSMVPHVTVSQYQGRLQGWQALGKTLASWPDIQHIAPVVNGQGMLQVRGSNVPVFVSGVKPNYGATMMDISNKMVEGSLHDLAPGKYGIVIGQGIAFHLGLTVGDKVVLLTPSISVTPAGFVPRLRRFTVVGIFNVGGGFGFDNSLAFIDMKDAQTLYQLGDAVSSLQLKLKDPYEAMAVSERLAHMLPEDNQVVNWTYQYGNFFHAVRMEKTMMFLILVLIIAIAAFNLVSTLVMVVNEKESAIAILRTFGATSHMIMRIFMVQGCMIGIVGTLLGIVLGVLLSWNVTALVEWLQHVFHTQFISSDVYFIDFLPSELHWRDVWHVGGIALLLSLLATIYPAWRASKVQPAEALRYE